MDDYIFVLGRDFQLSLLEVVSYLKSRRIAFKVKAFNKKLMLVSLEREIEPNMIFRLGGTIKIAKVLGSLDELKIPNIDKIKYSMACIETGKTNEINSRLKEIFKREHIKGFLKNGTDIGLSPSDFFRHNIFKEGFEILLYKDMIAEIIAVFNPKEYEARDQRPYLEREKLISIRLAKILINLSQAREYEKLLDPFCGSGTILQEALLLNINAIGMDVDSKTIHHADKNLKWLKNNYDFKSSYTLINKDARNASSYVEGADAAATEPYLGPYLKRLPSLRDARKTALGLSDLYFNVLKQLRIILKNGKAAIIVPKFKTKEQVPVFIAFDKLALKAGFRVYNPFPAIKVPVLYSPKGTKLDREIYILEKA